MSDKDLTLGFLLQSSDEEIEAYKKYIGISFVVIRLRGFDTTWAGLPPVLAAHLFYAASDRVEWVKLDIFLRDITGGKGKEERHVHFRVFLCTFPVCQP
jgi:hypothetical protein